MTTLAPVADGVRLVGQLEPRVGARRGSFTGMPGGRLSIRCTGLRSPVDPGAAGPWPASACRGAAVTRSRPGRRHRCGAAASCQSPASPSRRKSCTCPATGSPLPVLQRTGLGPTARPPPCPGRRRVTGCCAADRSTLDGTGPDGAAYRRPRRTTPGRRCRAARRTVAVVRGVARGSSVTSRRGSRRPPTRRSTAPAAPTTGLPFSSNSATPSGRVCVGVHSPLPA